MNVIASIGKKKWEELGSGDYIWSWGWESKAGHEREMPILLLITSFR